MKILKPILAISLAVLAFSFVSAEMDNIDHNGNIFVSLESDYQNSYRNDRIVVSAFEDNGAFWRGPIGWFGYSLGSNSTDQSITLYKNDSDQDFNGDIFNGTLSTIIPIPANHIMSEFGLDRLNFGIYPSFQLTKEIDSSHVVLDRHSMPVYPGGAWQHTNFSPFSYSRFSYDITEFSTTNTSDNIEYWENFEWFRFFSTTETWQSTPGVMIDIDVDKYEIDYGQRITSDLIQYLTPFDVSDGSDFYGFADLQAGFYSHSNGFAFIDNFGEADSWDDFQFRTIKPIPATNFMNEDNRNGFQVYNGIAIINVNGGDFPTYGKYEGMSAVASDYLDQTLVLGKTSLSLSGVHATLYDCLATDITTLEQCTVLKNGLLGVDSTNYAFEDEKKIVNVITSFVQSDNGVPLMSPFHNNYTQTCGGQTSCFHYGFEDWYIEPIAEITTYAHEIVEEIISSGDTPFSEWQEVNTGYLYNPPSDPYIIGTGEDEIHLFDCYNSAGLTGIRLRISDIFHVNEVLLGNANYDLLGPISCSIASFIEGKNSIDFGEDTPGLSYTGPMLLDNPNSLVQASQANSDFFKAFLNMLLLLPAGFLFYKALT